MDEMKDVEPGSFCEKYLGFPLDTGLFQCASHISPQYRGGMWKFKGNETIGYGYPDDDKMYHCINPAACYECDASPEVLGITATLFFLNSMAWRCHAEDNDEKGRWYATQYYALRDWMYDHFSEEDAAKVYWLLD